MTNLNVFYFHFNVSFQDVIVFRVDILKPHLLFGKLHSKSTHDLRGHALLASDMWQNIRSKY